MRIKFVNELFLFKFLKPGCSLDLRKYGLSRFQVKEIHIKLLIENKLIICALISEKFIRSWTHLSVLINSS